MAIVTSYSFIILRIYDSSENSNRKCEHFTGTMLIYILHNSQIENDQFCFDDEYFVYSDVGGTVKVIGARNGIVVLSSNSELVCDFYFCYNVLTNENISPSLFNLQH